MVAFVLCKDWSPPGSGFKAVSGRSRFGRNARGCERFFQVKSWCPVSECYHGSLIFLYPFGFCVGCLLYNMYPIC